MRGTELRESTGRQTGWGAVEALRVDQVMVTRPATIGPDATLGHLARLLAERGVVCVPVLDEGDRLVGVVGERELLQAMATCRCPRWSSEEPLTTVATTPVREVMRPRPFVLRPDDDLVHAARHLVRSCVSMVPVAVEDRLVGVLRIGDVVGLLSRATLTPV